MENSLFYSLLAAQGAVRIFSIRVDYSVTFGPRDTGILTWPWCLGTSLFVLDGSLLVIIISLLRFLGNLSATQSG